MVDFQSARCGTGTRNAAQFEMASAAGELEPWAEAWRQFMFHYGDSDFARTHAGHRPADRAASTREGRFEG